MTSACWSHSSNIHCTQHLMNGVIGWGSWNSYFWWLVMWTILAHCCVHIVLVLETSTVTKSHGCESHSFCWISRKWELYLTQSKNMVCSWVNCIKEDSAIKFSTIGVTIYYLFVWDAEETQLVNFAVLTVIVTL